ANGSGVCDCRLWEVVGSGENGKKRGRESFQGLAGKLLLWGVVGSGENDGKRGREWLQELAGKLLLANSRCTVI
nr:hypothetical protein [Tanacetum cinerariifolium]